MRRDPARYAAMSDPDKNWRHRQGSDWPAEEWPLPDKVAGEALAGASSPGLKKGLEPANVTAAESETQRSPRYWAERPFDGRAPR
jgi:hypothetical protein